MQMNTTKHTSERMRIVALAGLCAIAAVGTSTASGQVVSGPGSQIVLAGTVRDFQAAHGDFGGTDPVNFGQFSPSIAPVLDLSGLPVYTGAGRQVTSQWNDKDGNPIAPYGDPGLAGGHFDVDVYDTEPSTSEIYHEHQFDDKYNVTYVDIANDTRLLLDSVVGLNSYPNDLRVVFLNPHNGGGGIYVFESGTSGVITGYVAQGFDMIFTPSELTQLRVNFMSLAQMRQTNPGTSQSDAPDRDDSLSVRMYDVTTNQLVYELAVYNHYKKPKKNKKKKKSGSKSGIQPKVGIDACGVPFNDAVGTFGAAGSGAITDSSTFRQWFRDVPGTNLSARHDIALTLDSTGVYQYATDNFFPINGQLYGNAGGTNNDFFTYTISTDFTYNQCTDMFFEFEGNDDAWVFINGELVIDLGGIATPSKQFVALDRLNLVDGQTYSLEFFYAKRNPTPTSLFNMRTNIPLQPRFASLPMASALFD